MKRIGIKDKTFYYGNTVVLGAEFIFNCEIQKDKLVATYNKSVLKHPYFKVRPVIKNNEIFYEENNLDIPLINDEQFKNIKIATDETNGYPYAFYLNKDTLYFFIAHGLADYHGMSLFLNTFIGYLAIEHGFSQGNKIINVINYDNINDCLYPYESYKNSNGIKYNIPNMGKKFIKPKFDIHAKSKCVEFNINSNEFVSYFKVNNASFAPMLIDIISTAIDKKEGNDKIHPLAVVNADARGVFGSNCLTNFSESLLVPYRDDDKNLSPKDKAANFKAILKSQLTKENISFIINEKESQIKEIESGKIIKRKEETPTYALSYVGKDTFSGLFNFIKSYRPFPALASSPIIFVMVIAREDVINIQMHLSGEIKEYAEEIQKEMNKRGIATSSIVEVKFPIATLDPNNLKRV